MNVKDNSLTKFDTLSFGQHYQFHEMCFNGGSFANPGVPRELTPFIKSQGHVQILEVSQQGFDIANKRQRELFKLYLGQNLSTLTDITFGDLSTLQTDLISVLEVFSDTNQTISLTKVRFGYLSGGLKGRQRAILTSCRWMLNKRSV